MIKNIFQKVSIEAKYLDSDIKHHILDKLKNTMEGTCSLDNGYILTVKKIITFEENKIGCANSVVIFDVIYEADILKPSVGQIFNGKVCMIFQHGIFVDIYGKMKVLIPAKSMTGYVYQPDEKIFKNDEKLIEHDVDVSIDIVLIKYEKKQFSCIGKLHHSESNSESDSDSESN